MTDLVFDVLREMPQPVRRGDEFAPHGRRCISFPFSSGIHKAPLRFRFDWHQATVSVIVNVPTPTTSPEPLLAETSVVVP